MIGELNEEASGLKQDYFEWRRDEQRIEMLADAILRPARAARFHAISDNFAGEELQGEERESHRIAGESNRAHEGQNY
jgi:hypothetical protein